MSMQDPTDNPQSQEVSWQTCCWILITLGLNTVLQPCGCVGGWPNRYSPYLRSSPFTCLLDSLFVLSRLLVVSIWFKISPRKSFRLLVAGRFRDVDIAEYVRSTVRMTWIRWLSFLLGPLLQAIKLGLLKGVPTTQFYGFSFLVSFLLLEILFLLAYLEIKDNLIDEETMIEDYGLIGYNSFDDDLSSAEQAWCILVSVTAVMLVIYLACLAELPVFSGQLQVITVIAICVPSYMIFIAHLLGSARIQMYLEQPSRFARFLYIASPSENIFSIEKNNLDLGCFFLFVINFGTCLVVYVKYYDPSDTLNPGITAIFG